MDIVKRPKVLGGIAVALVVVLGAFIFLWRSEHANDLSIDAPLQRTFDAVPHIASYSQFMDTSARLSTRSLRIIGTYLVDTGNDRFGSYSTTTLYLGDERTGRAFNYSNIAIGKDIFLRVSTNDSLLKRTINQTSGWKHFQGGVIPKLYAGIAVDGPVQDNLQILRENGRYVRLIKKHGVDRVFSTPLLHYTFALSGATPPKDDALSAIVSHVGKDGTVEVWIDGKTGLPQYLLFTGDGYTATTTLSQFNQPQPIASPIAL